jgi:hypothetical protein
VLMALCLIAGFVASQWFFNNSIVSDGSLRNNASAIRTASSAGTIELDHRSALSGTSENDKYSTSMAKVDTTNPIRHIFQYGPPRSGSTTQFNIVCVALFLHIQTYYPELGSNTICTMAGSFTKDWQDDDTYKFTLQRDDIPQAVKSHVQYPDHQHINSSTLVFATANDKQAASATKAALSRDGFRVGIIQDLDTLKHIGIDGWLKVYADFFSLSPDQLEMMTEYFGLWDKLRQCCGLQMSQYYRNELVPVDQRNEMNPHSFCGFIDPNSLERRFMNAELYKQLDNYELMRRMNRPATVDGNLDGSYCSRYSNAIRQYGIPPPNRINGGLNSKYEGISNHWIEELNDPFTGIQHIVSEDADKHTSEATELTGENTEYAPCDGKQYLFFYSVNGFANQLEGIRMAMQIAYSTNRTLIMPPLLPHGFSNTLSSKFHGRERYFGEFTTDPKRLVEINNLTLGDVRAALTVQDKTEYPSWSEVMDFVSLSNNTGVQVIDLIDFVQSKSESCIHEFYNQPDSVSIVGISNKSTSWDDFTHLFTQQFQRHSIALIGVAFIFSSNSDMFQSHDYLFRIHDPIASDKILQGVRSFMPPKKVLDIIKAASVRLPNDYVGVHIRTRDHDGLKNCRDTALTNGFDSLIQELAESNTSYGSAIYLASNDHIAKECFNELSQNSYKVFTLNDIFPQEELGNVAKDIMESMAVDDGTKMLVVDEFLVALGAKVYFASINFPYVSTFQEGIKSMHSRRSELLQLVLPPPQNVSLHHLKVIPFRA